MSRSAREVRDVAILVWQVTWGVTALVLIAIGVAEWPWFGAAVGWALAVALFVGAPVVALIAHLIARKRPVRA